MDLHQGAQTQYHCATLDNFLSTTISFLQPFSGNNENCLHYFSLFPTNQLHPWGMPQSLPLLLPLG
jgi:hypothetical protein